jgi:hypothetical protein
MDGACGMHGGEEKYADFSFGGGGVVSEIKTTRNTYVLVGKL